MKPSGIRLVESISAARCPKTTCQILPLRTPHLGQPFTVLSLLYHLGQILPQYLLGASQGTLKSLSACRSALEFGPPESPVIRYHTQVTNCLDWHDTATWLI